MAKFSHLTDAELIELLKRDNMDAFDAIRERYRKALLLHAFGQVNNEQEAQWLVNTCLVNFWNRRYDHVSLDFNISAYLHKCLKNAIFHYYKDLKRHNKTFPPCSTPPEVETGEESIPYEKAVAVLEKTFALIPEKMRPVAFARYMGQTHKEIAIAFGISEKTSIRYIEATKKVFIDLLHKAP